MHRYGEATMGLWRRVLAGRTTLAAATPLYPMFPRPEHVPALPERTSSGPVPPTYGGKAGDGP